MDFINASINILFLVVTLGFFVLYVVSFILNIIRSVTSLKKLKKQPKSVKAVVTEIIEEKHNVHVKYKYTSPVNKQSFTDIMTFNKSDFKDQYYVDQEIEIVYPDTTEMKRVYYFPKFFSDQKQKIEAGPLFTDIIICVAGAAIFGYTLVAMLAIPEFKAFTGKVQLVQAGGIFPTAATTDTTSTGIFNMFTILIIMVIYFMLFSYVLERLISASMEHTHSYLKLYGIMTTAKVNTYKFGRTKDAKGNKEAQMKIEFRDNGDLIEANLNSHLYTETQEEYIKILYDPKHPKTTVYMR